MIDLLIALGIFYCGYVLGAILGHKDGFEMAKNHYERILDFY